MPKRIKESTVKKAGEELLAYPEVLKNVATKKDLEKLATKKDLERFVTKQELKQELEKFATKQELKQEIAGVRLEIREVKQDIDGVKQDLSEFKDQTITRLDKILATQERHEQERIFAYEQMRRQQEQIDKHTEEIGEIKEVLDLK